MFITAGFFLAIQAYGNFARQIWLQSRYIIQDLELKAPTGIGEFPSPVEKIPEEELEAADLILLGARREVKNRTYYDASYAAISYPGGDVSSDRGACTDVVIRAFRNAGIDLQQLIHEDMAREEDCLLRWKITGHFRYPVNSELP
jgi:hypothetical protein